MVLRDLQGGVTAPEGFTAAGIHAGIKRSRKPDLSLVLCDRPATAAAVFTRNRIQAAPVRISRRRLAQRHLWGVLINSGCANCLTGAAGDRDALAVSDALARHLGIPSDALLLGSTGLIGTRLPARTIVRAIPRLAHQLSRRHHEAAALAILTTDLRPKEAAAEARIGGRRLRVGGMAKGAGMIAPSMATMLAVITTDAVVSPALLRRELTRAAAQTFNGISVDGDMSTNDTVFALASGASGAVIRPGSAAARVFAALLVRVCDRLARQVVADGEGAMKVMGIRVTGARSARQAHAAARQVAQSPLVKTMLAGSDPNVGRIAAAVGASGAVFAPARLRIWLEGRRLVSGGRVQEAAAPLLRRLLRRPEVAVRIDLGAGTGQAQMWTCDLTAEYVRINAGYAT